MVGGDGCFITCQASQTSGCCSRFALRAQNLAAYLPSVLSSGPDAAAEPLTGVFNDLVGGTHRQLPRIRVGARAMALHT